MLEDFEISLMGKRVVNDDPDINAKIMAVCGEICRMSDVDEAIACIRSRLAGQIPDGNLAIVEYVAKERIKSCKARRGILERDLNTFVFGGF